MIVEFSKKLKYCSGMIFYVVLMLQWLIIIKSAYDIYADKRRKRKVLQQKVHSFYMDYNPVTELRCNLLKELLMVNELFNTLSDWLLCQDQLTMTFEENPDQDAIASDLIVDSTRATLYLDMQEQRELNRLRIRFGLKSPCVYNKHCSPACTIYEAWSSMTRYQRLKLWCRSFIVGMAMSKYCHHNEYWRRQHYVFWKAGLHLPAYLDLKPYSWKLTNPGHIAECIIERSR